MWQPAAVIGALQRCAADIFDFHARDAMPMKAEKLGGLDGHIDKPVARIRSAIVDAHHDRSAVGQVGDANIRRQWQRRVRRRDRMHVEDFAIRGVAAVEIVAVPGGHADRAVVRILFGDINPARDRIRLADPVHAAAFRHRLTRFYDARAGRNAVARINPAGHLAIEALATQGRPNRE
jgi:hypothetical protein